MITSTVMNIEVFFFFERTLVRNVNPFSVAYHLKCDPIYGSNSRALQ